RHDEWHSTTRKYIKVDHCETGKTVYSILHRIMDLTVKKEYFLFKNKIFVLKDKTKITLE
ncbi:hypothetical protein, partial [Enterococcus faecium]|uniref:hypothetical protein n=1 Tax=Enterococcus faecium TaxID=1352 RepID=UPI0035D5A94D